MSDRSRSRTIPKPPTAAIPAQPVHTALQIAAALLTQFVIDSEDAGLLGWPASTDRPRAFAAPAGSVWFTGHENSCQPFAWRQPSRGGLGSFAGALSQARLCRPR